MQATYGGARRRLKGVQGRSPGKLLPKAKQEGSAKRDSPTRSDGHKACVIYSQVPKPAHAHAEARGQLAAVAAKSNSGMLSVDPFPGPGGQVEEHRDAFAAQSFEPGTCVPRILQALRTGTAAGDSNDPRALALPPTPSPRSLDKTSLQTSTSAHVEWKGQGRTRDNTAGWKGGEAARIRCTTGRELATPPDAYYTHPFLLASSLAACLAENVSGDGEFLGRTGQPHDNDSDHDNRAAPLPPLPFALAPTTSLHTSTSVGWNGQGRTRRHTARCCVYATAMMSTSDAVFHDAGAVPTRCRRQHPAPLCHTHRPHLVSLPRTHRSKLASASVRIGVNEPHAEASLRGQRSCQRGRRRIDSRGRRERQHRSVATSEHPLDEDHAAFGERDKTDRRRCDAPTYRMGNMSQQRAGPFDADGQLTRGAAQREARQIDHPVQHADMWKWT
ncbi:hypothetical protein BJ912DRAFT_1144874 [Pholiota molesta]|nr:hypothetical protein BJ912DRAFT_1144874 [Pholiota molesta]